MLKGDANSYGWLRMLKKAAADDVLVADREGRGNHKRPKYA